MPLRSMNVSPALMLQTTAFPPSSVYSIRGTVKPLDQWWELIMLGDWVLLKDSGLATVYTLRGL